MSELLAGSLMRYGYVDDISVLDVGKTPKEATTAI